MGLANQKLVIVALHGFFGCPQDFDPLREAFLPHCDWISLPLPGHSFVENLRKSFSLEDLFLQIHSALQGRPAILLGYSMGGRLALQYAVNHSQSLKGLILIGASPGIEDLAERKARYAADVALAERFIDQSIQDAWSEWARNPLIASQKNIPQPVYDEMVKNRLRHNPAALAKALKAWSPGLLPSLWDKLHQIQSPVLLVNGSRDEKFTKINEKMHKLLPESVLKTINTAGHMAHLENMNSFASIMKEWMMTLNDN